MIRLALAALCLLPAALAAEVWVDNPAACEGLDLASDRAAFDAQGEENTILFPEGMGAIEYYCEFESPIELGPDAPDTQTRAGYCMEPGPYVYPTVFVIGTGFGGPGEVHLWSADNESGEALVFHACSQQ